MNPAEYQNPSPLRLAWIKGTRAARANRIPGGVLWLFGIALVGGYFFVEPVHTLLEQVGAWKQQGGFWFSAISTSVFGGIIPALVIRMQGKHEAGIKLAFAGYLVSNAMFWAVKGIEVDLLYRFQAWCFDFESVVLEIALKTAFDQLVYVPLWGIVTVVLFYDWRESGYSFGQFKATLGRGWYAQRVLPVVISNWAVWIPAVILIYSLPLPLQLPVQNLVLCFWVLMLAMFTRPDQNDRVQSAS